VQLDADDRLVQRTLAGELEAFSVLVDQYRTRAVNLAYRMLGDRERADDAAQEAFVRVYRALRRYRPCGKFRSWLLATVSHVCIDHLRRKPFQAASLDEMGVDPAALGTGHDPQAAYGQAETQARVHAALGRLPEPQRLAIVLTHLQGLSFEEAGEVMGQPVNTVKSHAHRARARLKMLLTDYVQESAA
jgi:RNA polymerase sigma-70 factor, ECF subfamily